MNLPDPAEWQVTNTKFAEACKRLYPFAVEWRDVLLSRYEPPEEQIAALDAFIDACESRKTGE